MSPDRYRERLLAQLDTTRTEEKDRIILGFIEQLYPGGDPDHEVAGADFMAEAVRLLAAFHPSNLDRLAETMVSQEPTETPEF